MTKLEPKETTKSRRVFFLVLALAAIGSLVGLSIYMFRSTPTNCTIAVPSLNSGQTQSEHLDNYKNYDCVNLEVVDTPQARQQGLSGRDRLLPNQGMLFVYDQMDYVCIWMKDMNFPIDIVWLSESKQIIKIEENVQPDTYPKTFCGNGTKYVVELSSGTAELAGLRIGQTLKL